jgi:hypothetical protein
VKLNRSREGTTKRAASFGAARTKIITTFARANALENNVTIYHTINGRRVAFKSVKQTLKAGTWHSLRVDFERDEFTLAFDGKKVIKAIDESFKDSGKVGLWTKADSLTLFDDFSYGGE